jgi:hypothetical protein
VDYFLVLRDERRDTEAYGYEDDAQNLDLAFKKHQQELENFRVWSIQRRP